MSHYNDNVTRSVSLLLAEYVEILNIYHAVVDCFISRIRRSIATIKQYKQVTGSLPENIDPIRYYRNEFERMWYVIVGLSDQWAQINSRVVILNTGILTGENDLVLMTENLVCELVEKAGNASNLYQNHTAIIEASEEVISPGI